MTTNAWATTHGNLACPSPSHLGSFEPGEPLSGRVE